MNGNKDIFGKIEWFIVKLALLLMLLFDVIIVLSVAIKHLAEAIKSI